MDTGGVGGAPFDYEFSFDDDDFVDNNNNMQMPSKHKNKTAQENIGLGSSSGSTQPRVKNQASSRETLTMPTFTPTPSRGLTVSDPVLNQQPLNMAPMGTSSSTPLATTLQNNSQTTAIVEFHQPLELNQAQPNPANSGPVLSNASNMPSPRTAICPIFTGAPQLHPPPMEYVELGSSAANNLSGLNHANSTQNFMPQTAIQSYQCSNPQLVNAPNVGETNSSFFNPALSGATQLHHPVPMQLGLTVQDGVVQPPNNVPPAEHLPLSLTLGTPSQHDTNAMMARLDVNQRPPQINQQQATLYSQQLNAPHRVLTPSGYWPQPNQAMTADGVFVDPRMLPYGAAQLRPQGPQQLSNQLQLNQVQPTNTFGPQCHYPIQGSRAIVSRLQEVGRHQQQPEQVQAMPNFVVHSQIYNSTGPRPSMLSRPLQISDGQQVNQVSLRSNIADPQHGNSGFLRPLMPFRFPPVQLDEILHQTNSPREGTSRDSPNEGGTYKDHNTGVGFTNQHESSPNNFEVQGTPEQRGYAAKRHATSAQQCELGESSLPAKRYRWGLDMQQMNSVPFIHNEMQRNTFQSERAVDINSTVSIPSNPRQQRNGVYDPMFEGMGLPIDPHIRLFTAKSRVYHSWRNI